MTDHEAMKDADKSYFKASFIIIINECTDVTYLLAE